MQHSRQRITIHTVDNGERMKSIHIGCEFVKNRAKEICYVLTEIIIVWSLSNHQ